MWVSFSSIDLSQISRNITLVVCALSVSDIVLLALARPITVAYFCTPIFTAPAEKGVDWSNYFIYFV